MYNFHLTAHPFGVIFYDSFLILGIKGEYSMPEKIHYTIKQLKKQRNFRYLFSAIAAITSSIIQVYVIQSFIRPAGILSGGFTGIAILIDRISSLFGFGISTSIMMLVLNIPVALLCWKTISRKFTCFSLFQIFLTSILLTVCNFKPMFDDIVLNVIFGGVFNGISILIALKGNSCTGGTDFIALYVSTKTGKSIWSYVFFSNIIILGIFGMIFGWYYAGYSILFQFVSTQMISTFHHRYDQLTLQITTEHANNLIRAYTTQFRHGISCTEAIGGYSGKKMYLLHTVVSSYEVNDIVYLMKQTDSHVIINVFKTQNFYGRFYRAPID